MTRQTASSLRMFLAACAILLAAPSAFAIDTGRELGAACRDFSLNGGKAIETECGKFLFDWFTEFAAQDEERRRLYLEGGPYVEAPGPCFRLEGEISFREMAGVIADQIDLNADLAGLSPGEAVQASLAARYPCPPAEEGAAE
ncbi:MAG TPA: hypothetical protein PLA85_01580 [Micropepsaceae bacterium]|nr:hypothetical protein [Micropepsaceae bacterium]